MTIDTRAPKPVTDLPGKLHLSPKTLADSLQETGERILVGDMPMSWTDHLPQERRAAPARKLVGNPFS